MIVFVAAAYACTVSGSNVAGHPLFLSDGTLFADTGTIPRARVDFAAADLVPAALSGGGVSIRAWLRGTDIVVYAARPYTIDGWFVVRSGPLDVEEAGADALDVGVPTGSDGALLDGRFLPAAPIAAHVRCGALRLSPVDSPVAGANRRVTHADDDGPGYVVALRASPGGPVLGSLTNGLDAYVVETSGNALRVRVELGGYAVFGWVDAADTAEPPPAGMFGFGAGGGGACDVDVGNLRRCGEALPLSVKVGDVVTPIGTLAAGTSFVALTNGTDTEAEIVLLDSWLDVDDDLGTGKLLLAPARARDCPLVTR